MKSLFPVSCNTWKNMGNDQKPMCSSCIAHLCAHPALNPTISKFYHSSYMVIITLYNSKILLSLHCFLTPHFETFTYLIIGILGINNTTIFFILFFFFEIGRNYVSIIINIIIIIIIIIITVSTETEKEKSMREKYFYL